MDFFNVFLPSAAFCLPSILSVIFELPTLGEIVFEPVTCAYVKRVCKSVKKWAVQRCSLENFVLIGKLNFVYLALP